MIEIVDWKKDNAYLDFNFQTQLRCFCPENDNMQKDKKPENILGLKPKSISQIVQYMFLFNEIDI